MEKKVKFINVDIHKDMVVKVLEKAIVISFFYKHVKHTTVVSKKHCFTNEYSNIITIGFFDNTTRQLKSYDGKDVEISSNDLVNVLKQHMIMHH